MFGCCHKINSKKTTLREIDQVFMVYPPKKIYVCKRCGKSFQFDIQSQKKGGQSSTSAGESQECNSSAVD